MPNGIYPIPQFDQHPDRGRRARRPLTLRLRTWWRRDRLDEELADGADPASTPELALRSTQLESRAVRARLANSIVELLGEAHGPNLGPFTRAGERQQAEIREYADNLRALVARLRSDRPVDVQGAAMVARLVNDRTSPLYGEGAESLGSAVLSARLALDRSGSVDDDLPSAA
jgi:hypothetical protein